VRTACSALGLIVLGSFAAGKAQSIEPLQAIVIGTHSAESTRTLAAARGAAEGGHYALVRLLDGAYHRKTYALVYVPPGLKVRKDDRVEIAPSEFNLAAEPGTGVVLGLAGEAVPRP
jgi:hypothetical protein